MKIYKIFTIVSMALTVVSCREALFEDIESAGVTVVENENVKCNGKVITVKKGQPVTFNIDGDPDYITFYSGEIGRQYAYRDSLRGDIDDIVSASLKFTVWAQYGVNRSNEESSAYHQMQVLYATEDASGNPVFPGFSRNFEEDSIMVEEQIPWQYLIAPDLMPDSGNSNDGDWSENNTSGFYRNSFDIDMTQYLGKKFTLAMVLNRDKKEAPASSSASDPAGTTILQSTFHFEDMRLETTWKNGTVKTIYAEAFGFTPINMKNKTVFSDHSDNTYNMPSDLEYGAVSASVEGFWNLTNIATGYIDISGCAANNKWKYSWIVSDYLDFTLLDEANTGVGIKATNLPLESYDYTYENVGTYKATFVMTNVNFEDSQQKVLEFIVNVVE